MSSHSSDAALAFDDQPYAPAPRSDAVRLPLLAALGVQALVLGSLFTGLDGPAVLGELRADGAVAGVVLIVMSAVLSGAVLDVRGGRAIVLYLPLIGCVLLSYAVNVEAIQSAQFLGRDGQGKFLTSLFVLGLFLAFFHACFCLMAVYGVGPLLRAARKMVLFASWLLIFELTFEVATWFIPPLRDFWLSMRAYWTFSELTDRFRLTGFAPEPSYNGITILALVSLLGVQWAGAGWRQALFGRRNWLTGSAIAALLGFALIANARTFMVGALGAAVAWFLVAGPAWRLPAVVKSAVITLAPIAVQAVMIWSVYQGGAEGRSVSNVTRSIGMLTATDLWRQNPLLGLGLGQYGFHFRDAVPSWGLESWEVARYFEEERLDLLGTGGLPPSFSIFSRIGAELGGLGFLAWVLPPAFAIRRALVHSPGPLTTLAVCALAAQFWTGLSLDSFRNVYYWLWLAVLLALVRPPGARAVPGAGAPGAR